MSASANNTLKHSESNVKKSNFPIFPSRTNRTVLTKRLSIYTSWTMSRERERERENLGRLVRTTWNVYFRPVMNFVPPHPHTPTHTHTHLDTHTIAHTHTHTHTHTHRHTHQQRHTPTHTRELVLRRGDFHMWIFVWFVLIQNIVAEQRERKRSREREREDSQQNLQKSRGISKIGWLEKRRREMWKKKLTVAPKEVTEKKSAKEIRH